MIAPITSKALLDVAGVLARIDDPSTTVHLRRAISSAYYALFHGLITDATRLAMGDEPAREDDRFVVSRWYVHGEIRSVSQWVVRRAEGRAVPKGVAHLLDAHPPTWSRSPTPSWSCSNRDTRRTTTTEPTSTRTTRSARLPARGEPWLGSTCSAGPGRTATILVLIGAARRVVR